MSSSKPASTLARLDRGPQTAEFVDQAMVEGVRTGTDPASGHRLDRFDAQVATLGDPLHEVVVEQVHLGPGRAARR